MRRIGTIAVIVGLLGVGMWNCGEDKGTTPVLPAETAIGPEGGTAASEDGKATVVVPGDAVSSAVTVTIAGAAGHPQGAIAAYEFGPGGTQFDLPVQLKIQYDPGKIPAGVDESELWMGKVVGNDWQRVPGSSVDADANTVTAPVQSFSAYGVVAPSGGDPGLTTADYAVWGTILNIGAGGIADVAIQKNDGTADASKWPYQKATGVKLIGSREIALTEKPVGDMIRYMLPEVQTLIPGETYQFQMTVEGRTFTSKNAVRVLENLTVTTSVEQPMEPGTSVMVQWNTVSGAAGYVVQLRNLDAPMTVKDAKVVAETATEKALPGELFGEEGTYSITVQAFDETIAPHITQWGDKPGWEMATPSPLYGFDDPKVLGVVYSMALGIIYVQVGTGGEGGEDAGQLEVTVSGGIPPIFSWTGENAQMLTVMPDEGGDAMPMWGIMSVSDTGIASPVTYGQAPSGAMELFPSKPLVAGATYHVSVVGVEMALGEKAFTP